MSIPKQYRVGRASFVQDELFMKLVLYVLRADELSQDELFIQLATLDQDNPYRQVWSSFLAPSVAFCSWVVQGNVWLSLNICQ